jgi:hypothetical protein
MSEAVLSWIDPEGGRKSVVAPTDDIAYRWAALLIDAGFIKVRVTFRANVMTSRINSPFVKASRAELRAMDIDTRNDYRSKRRAVARAIRKAKKT